ncbi:Uncharacterized protein Rs2_26586 [Raphanus sativus]|nr:Uncharacterized protein Rs2_26586 [Raphanus sativus]
MWEQKNYWIEHSSDLNKEERPERKPKNRWRNKSETTQEGQKVLNVGCAIGGGDFYMSQNFDVSCRWLCHWTSTARLSLRLRIAPQKKKLIQITRSMSFTAMTLFCTSKYPSFISIQSFQSTSNRGDMISIT